MFILLLFMFGKSNYFPFYYYNHLLHLVQCSITRTVAPVAQVRGCARLSSLVSFAVFDESQISVSHRRVDLLSPY